MSPKPSFIVLKQFNGKGPIYKVEVCTKTLKVINKEVLNGIPDEWTTDDFYSLLNEGNRLDTNWGELS
jgi:hypothetical protein